MVIMSASAEKSPDETKLSEVSLYTLDATGDTQLIQDSSGTVEVEETDLWSTLDEIDDTQIHQDVTCTLVDVKKDLSSAAGSKGDSSTFFEDAKDDFSTTLENVNDESSSKPDDKDLYRLRITSRRKLEKRKRGESAESTAAGEFTESTATGESAESTATPCGGPNEKRRKVSVITIDSDTEEPDMSVIEIEDSIILFSEEIKKDVELFQPMANLPERSTRLRPIIIDGCNIAFGHDPRGVRFSSLGLKICADYFKKLGHEVRVFVPQFRKHHSATTDPQLLDVMEKEGTLIYTPSRSNPIDGKMIVSYDDRFIVQYADANGGVIVSRDNYRDLWNENPEWRDTIDKRLLMPTWVGDTLMFPKDPLGRHGPNLEEFLRF